MESNTISIEGRDDTGRYRVTCDCGQLWNGQVTHREAAGLSPALPIAEACAHHQLEHPAVVLRVTFSRPFAAWLTAYWDGASRLESAVGHVARFLPDPRA